LDKNKLANFWQKHGSTFKGLNLEQKDKIVFVGNDEVSYEKYLPMVYKVLDDNASELTNTSAEVIEATAEPTSLDA
jgi:hypothetical protein